MANNFLEQLVYEWYEYQGYFVRRNIAVGKRRRGGYECELDIVAFNPSAPHLVHIEPSMDAESWEKREVRFRKKFDAGRKHIPSLFPGVELPERIEQIAVFASASRINHPTVGGGRVLLVSDLLRDIFEDLSERKLSSSTVPEHHALLRTLQFVVEYRKRVFDMLQ